MAIVTGMTAAKILELFTGKASATHAATHAAAGSDPVTLTAAQLSDLTETVQDIVAALIVAGTNVTATYNDAAGTFTINASTGTVTDPEIVRDVIGASMVAGSGIQITVNDAGDTITIASTAVLPTRQVIAGTGLIGGGDLSADRTLSVAYGNTGNTAAAGNDSRIVNAVQATRAIIPGMGLTGGGDLSANRTLSVAYGTAAGTAAAGNDSRIVNAVQKSANLSDLADAATARTNLGLNTAATVGALPIPDPGSFYPTDTIAAALQLIGDRERYGTGSPEGVITAAVGTYYTDTAGTNGAWRWLKKTGTGNTGWTVLEGDTGWRYFTDAQLLNTYAAYVAVDSYRPALRRIGSAVYLSGAIGNITAAKAVGGGILTLPSGFQPNSVNPGIVTGRVVAFSGATAVPNTLLNIASNVVQIAYPGAVDAALTAGILQMAPWTTTDAWPATLPGAAL